MNPSTIPGMQVSTIASSSSSSRKLRVPRNPAIRIRQAVRDNNVSLLQRLSNKVELRNTDRNRLSSLSWAAVEGSLEVFEWLLLDYGHDDLELSRDADNNTILHLLASVPSSQPTSLPYSALFPPLPPSHLPSPAEQSRRSIQMTGLYHTLFPFLLDWSNSGGKTPLHIAAQSGNSPFISLLLSYGADPDLTDLQGNSPLHYAAAWGHMEVARVLLEEGGAAWGIRNFEGFSAADYAYSEEMRVGLEAAYESVKFMRREKRRMETEGEMYEGDGASRRSPAGNGAVPSGIIQGNRWRSGSASTGASWVGSNSMTSGGSGSGPQNSSGLHHGEMSTSPRPAPPRLKSSSSRNFPGPPVTQYPRRPPAVKGHSSPPVPDSGYATPRYNPTGDPTLSRSSSQSQLQTLLRSRSAHPSLGPTPPSMSRQGSNQTPVAGETSQRSSPVISPPVPRPVLLAPQISITPQEPTVSAFETPPSDYRYNYDAYARAPSSSSGRPVAAGRSPSLPHWESGGDDSRTPARPTAAGPPVVTPESSQMIAQSSSPQVGAAAPSVEGIRRSNSAQVGLGLAVGRGLLGGRI